jgi:uncharacterized membrane protein YhaH (DUF805 family)
MEWKSLFFSFRGRVNRAKYWVVIVVVAVVDGILRGIGFVAEQRAGDSLAALLTLLAIALVILGVAAAFFVAGLAVATKRLHDRDKSAWWLLVFYLLPAVLAATGAGVTLATDSWLGIGLFGAVTFAIGAWAFIELGCLRGTPGPNRYGPDPLARS